MIGIVGITTAYGLLCWSILHGNPKYSGPYELNKEHPVIYPGYDKEPYVIGDDLCGNMKGWDKCKTIPIPEPSTLWLVLLPAFILLRKIK